MATNQILTVTETEPVTSFTTDDLISITGIDTDGTNFWIIGQYGNTHEQVKLYKVGPDRLTILNGSGVDVPKSGGWASEVAYNSGFVYVRAHPNGPIFKYDVAQDTLTTTLLWTVRFTFDITFLGNDLWQTSDSGSRQVFDQNGNSFTGPVSDRKSLTSDGTHLYVGWSGNQKIYKMDTAGNVLEIYSITNPASGLPNRLCYHDGIFYSTRENEIVELEIEVEDNTPPVPDLASLPDATGQCSATISSSPTATDNSSGTITGTTTDALTRTTQGTSVVTWTFDDGNGNTSTQTQNIVVKDVTDPVPDVATLQAVTGECSATISSPPTAMDNCSGTITGTTTDALTRTTQGTSVVTWTFADGNGNTSTQTQNIIVDDITTPVPDLASLPDATGQCSATITTRPTATDNCSGTITGITTAPLTRTTQGTSVVTWTFDDGNGNTSTQTQNIVVEDTTPPVISDITLDTNILWPPNHKYRTITVSVTAIDNCDPSVAISGTVVSDEPDEDKTGDGKTTGDIKVTSGEDVFLSSNEDQRSRSRRVISLN